MKADEVDRDGNPRRIAYIDKRCVEVDVFGDRGDVIGRLFLSRGHVLVSFYYLPSMVTDDATADILAKKVGDALRAAVLRAPDLVDPHKE